jgi:membrane protein
MSWGGAFAAIFWVLISLAFSYYVARFGGYNKSYGSLGAAIGFMTWISDHRFHRMGTERGDGTRDATGQHDRTRESLGARGAIKADTVAP